MPFLRRRQFALTLLLFVPALFARAEIEFAGILVTSEKTLFRLMDKSGVASPAWVTLGQTFADYKIKSYDAARDVLTLAKSDALIEVRLRDANVQPDSTIVIGGMVTMAGGEKLTVTRATLLFGQTNTFPLKNGVVCHITPTRLPDGNLEFACSFERPGPDGKMERLSAPRVQVLPGHPFSIRVGSDKNPDDSYGFSFTPQKD